MNIPKVGDVVRWWPSSDWPMEGPVERVIELPGHNDVRLHMRDEEGKLGTPLASDVEIVEPMVPRSALEASEARVRELTTALQEIEAKGAHVCLASDGLPSIVMPSSQAYEDCAAIARAALSSPSGVGDQE